jgi:hypothetical protein
MEAQLQPQLDPSIQEPIPMPDPPAPAKRAMTIKLLDKLPPPVFFIAGVDTPNCHIDEADDDPAAIEQLKAAPWYEPEDAESLDRIVARLNEQSISLDALADYYQRLASMYKARSARRASRIAKLCGIYQDILQAAAPVPPGGSWKNWKGPFSGGTYRNQPGRLPEIKITDKQAALAKGYCREKVEIVQDTDAIRAADPSKLEGVELIPQAAVSFSAPKDGKQ